MGKMRAEGLVFTPEYAKQIKKQKLSSFEIVYKDWFGNPIKV